MLIEAMVRVGGRSAAWLLLAFAALTARAQPVAIVIDVEGLAQAEEKSVRRDLRLLESLTAGTRLSIGKASKVVLLYLESGAQFSAAGPSRVEVALAEVRGVVGTVPVRQASADEFVVRLRRDRIVQGGVVLRSLDPPPGEVGSELTRRKPPPGAPFARRVAYALWLEEVGAQAEAREAWRRLAQERPSDEGIARRAR